MRRTHWKTVSTLVTMGLLSSCTDRTISGPTPAAVAPASMTLAPSGAPMLDLAHGNSGKASLDFTVGEKGGVFLVGDHAVVIPAHGICNPATSSYGPTTWDAPCRPLASSLKIHAEVLSENGRTWVDFQPALRFVPSSNSNNWAYIYMFTPGARSHADLSKFNILYSPHLGAAGIDESAHDATLRTYVDRDLRTSMRRIKHFSGYTASSGFVASPCTPSIDPTCVDSTATIAVP